MGADDTRQANEEARAAWEQNASFWDLRMREGNDFFEMLLWPVTERLLEIRQGGRILDVACGNGVTSRRLAALGAQVTAVDFSEAMIARAKQRSRQGEAIRYDVVDATDLDALLALGNASFDAVLCNMALMDMAEIAPLFQAVPKLLRSGGRFVFSLVHPCFNNPFITHTARLEERGQDVTTVYAVEITRYLSGGIQLGNAIQGQPVLHPYFHRSLTDLLAAGFKAGLVLDAFEETAFPPDYAGGTFSLSWNGKYSEIPPVLIVRMRSL
jgi:2-polyprenyl-3-methyl-5-hydroxy-6-metoxy-1,4-benzoquinol methylase